MASAAPTRPAQRDQHRVGCNAWNLEADAAEGIGTICVVLDNLRQVRTLAHDPDRAAKGLFQSSRSLPPERGPFLDQRAMPQVERNLLINSHRYLTFRRSR